MLGQHLLQLVGRLGHVAALLVEIATVFKYFHDVSDKVRQTPVLVVIDFILNGLKI